jgi:hypothetical protein
MRRLSLLVALALAASCNDAVAPAGRTDLQLHIVVQDSLAPPLLATRDSFWAKPGVDRSVRLFYQGATPADTGEEFLRFEVSGEALFRKPNGTAFGPNDSILITVTIGDPSRLLFTFEPSGLQFNQAHPARLKVHYFHSDKDFDDDGGEDEEDDRIEGLLDLWHRSAPGALWSPAGAVQFEEEDEIEANIFSFSQHAVAW